MHTATYISPREQQILSLIASEYTTTEIAQELFISVETVKTHRKNLLAKFRARNIAGLVVKGIKCGILKVI